MWASAAVAAAGGAIAGLAAGLALRTEVSRLSVRGGEPEQAACSDCGSALAGRLALRCGHCGQWIGAPAAIELTTAAVITLLIAKFGAQPALGAFIYLGVVGVALTQIDVAVQRLPDRLTLPAYPALALLLAVAAAISDDWPAFLRAILGGLALSAGYLLLGVVSGGQVGGGDIKLAGLAGLVLGWLGWHTLVVGASAGFVLAALASVVLLAARRISRRSRISFGPFLLAGAYLAMLTVPTATR